ncbi:unnamed protein product [Adineta steineri]|uniref:Uncharacterized protein n=1 Tax=Adineta steineri TaxID=433720 RepID=A0A814Y9W2_9BILA|nr:unnamed protein product [Adineta steineri]CAF4183917.1 unnamed protein product [Adineta steineri]
MNIHQIIFLIGFLSTRVYSASNSNDRADLLPRSVIELKKYYEVVENFEQRGILTEEQARQEKQLYIERASTLIGKDRLLTTKEFLNYDKHVSAISFSNIIAVLAGLIICIAGLIYISCYVKPNLTEISIEMWEKLFYCFAFSLMFLNNHSWLGFLGCLASFATLKISFYLGRFGQQTDRKLSMSFILSVSWSIVAIYQQNREVGYLVIVPLEILCSRIIQKGELPALLGFTNHTLLPSITISSFLLMIMAILLHLIPIKFLTSPFTQPLLFIGSFVYIIGLFILSSKFYYGTVLYQNVLSLLQIFTFLNGLGLIWFASMFDLPFLQNIIGAIFVFWLSTKYVERANWKTIWSTVISLLGLGIFLYGFAYFYKTIF